ncbi:MAG TPA: hypothetical protein VF678_12640, partial [bacterium]
MNAKANVPDNGSGRPMVGKLLVDEKLITLEQLEKALSEQQDRAMRLGQMVVDLGYAQETEVLKVINRHYRLGVTNLEEPWTPKRAGVGGMVDTLLRMRVSIRAKLSIAIIVILLITILVLSFVILSRQRDNLYQQT